MAKIDIAALKKFRDVWSPVMDSIPAVLEMAEKQSDIESGIAAEEARFTALKASMESEITNFKSQLAKVKDTIATTAAKRDKVLADYDVFVRDTDVKIAAANKAIAELDAKLRGKTDELNAAVQAAEKTLAGKLADLDAQYAARVEAVEADIRAVEQKRRAAEKALDTLRAKLG